MSFQVILTDNAKANLRHYYGWAAQNAPLTAGNWLNRFHDALARLSETPERCPLAPENDASEKEIRQFVFGKRTGAFRVLFRIVDDEVRILHIRRAAMHVAEPDELHE